MHFSVALSTALLALFTSATTAAPLSEARATIDPPARYYLQTKVVNGNHTDHGTNKTDLWVFSYHTGAGLGDAALSSNKSWAWEGYLNGSQQLFTYPDNDVGPWPLAVVYDNSYQTFAEATISVSAEPTTYEGFFFNSSGLQYNESYAGWLACDWWLDNPQLFNINGFLPDRPLPSSCSKVELLPVAV